MFGVGHLVTYLTDSLTRKNSHLYHDCTRTGNVEVLKLWQLKEIQVFRNPLA